MKYADVVLNVKKLASNLPQEDEFVYALLSAYGTPKATVSRLKVGQLNLAKESSEVLLKKRVYFKPAKDNLLGAIEALKTAKATKTNDPRFLIVTDFTQMLAVDRKTGDTLDCKVCELDAHFDFFLPLAGMEKTKLSNENPADVKAAEKMAKLFDIIKQDNSEYVRDHPHWMNIFLSRLLFCLFAEDTGIFPENAVCNAIASHTAEDGSDLTEFFERLFTVLDMESREALSEEMKVFPYVNGGLFKDHYPVPNFSARSRRMIIESGTLVWAEINPDIFGSMFQAVLDPEERHNLGQHYTSVTNIMKVIEPLFLNDFKEDLEKACGMGKGKKSVALYRLLDRIASVKIFDPACGSGNFLIIAYKELRKLEMAVFKELQTIEGVLPLSRMQVSQFYGIEIADFACGTAILAMWLAEHQMNLEYKKVFGRTLISLPLKEGAHIVCDNACRIDWETVCPKNEGDEIYILGNPPYLGARMQTKDQKADMAAVFGKMNGVNSLDYIACWFYKASQYIRGNFAQFAFVSTNSICQGEQVALLWPKVLGNDLEIGFAHQSFKWTNNAKGSAAVICIVVGVRNVIPSEKKIFHGSLSTDVKNISPYLTATSNLIITKRSASISSVPRLVYGNQAIEGGNLILGKAEKEALLEEFPEAEQFIRRLTGADDYINGKQRWCLWISAEQLDVASKIPQINERISKVKSFRERSGDVARSLVDVPYRFRYVHDCKHTTLILPRTTSERREYLPIGFLSKEYIITDAAQVIYDPEPYIFGILSSKMHMAWMKAVAGRLKSDYRYSNALCYNSFPFPDLTEEQKHTIAMHVSEVLSEREKHSGKTMAQLYDPDKMPAGLREAHHQLDIAVDRIYRSKPFASDEERLEYLFMLYEEMIAKERLV